MSSEAPECPCCHRKLHTHNYKSRIDRSYNGSTRFIEICRYQCSSCQRMHSGLPDFLVPYKHYEVEVIENAVDDVIEPGAPEADNYPCTGAFKNWKKWVAGNTDQIDGSLKSIGSKLDELGTDLLESSDSLLTKLRNDSDWLSTVCRVIYNSAMALKPVSRLPGNPPASVRDNKASPVSSSSEEDKDYESGRKPEMAGRGSTSAIRNNQPAAGQEPRYRKEKSDPLKDFA